MRLTHRQIEIFRAVMATGQVTRAAQALHTSQPTVSRELARLEQVLGMALFERVRGRLQPTARALAWQAEVERSFVGLERLAATARSLRDFAGARLSVACLPAFSHALLPEAARGFLGAFPAAHLSVQALESPGLEQALSAQRFDLGLSERADPPPGTHSRVLMRANEVVVMPAGHPLAARRSVRAVDFHGLPTVGLGPEDPYRAMADALFEAQGVARRLVVETTSAVSVCALVRQGLGVAIVNPLTALALAGPGLIVRPLAFRLPFQVSLVTPERRPSNPLREAFERALARAADGYRQRFKGLAAAD